MRVAVLADVHGNLPALEAVLEDIHGLDVDRIVLLGDIAGGPMPGETLDRLAALGERPSPPLALDDGCSRAVTPPNRYRYVGPAELHHQPPSAEAVTVGSGVVLDCWLAERERAELDEPLLSWWRSTARSGSPHAAASTSPNRPAIAPIRTAGRL